MSRMPNGLYEQIINKKLDKELASTDQLSYTAPVDQAEAAKILAKYVAEVVERGLESLHEEKDSLAAHVDMVNRIVSAITELTGIRTLTG